MSKIMFVGDPHIQSNSPSSRKETNEQYRQVILDKLLACANICKEQGITDIVYLGDLYNSSSTILYSYLAECFNVFNQINNMGIRQHTIIGNHDMYFQNEEEFKNTLLYLTFLTGMVNHLDEIKIDNVTIKGFDYNKDFIHVNELKNQGTYNICVAHSFYENERFGGTGNSNLTQQKCIELGFNAYVLGHDHVPYPEVIEPMYRVIRPGSLTRGSSKTCNLYRQVQVSIFDTVLNTWSYVDIPVKPGVEVFNEKVIMSKDIDLNLEKLLENFSASKGMDIYDVIDKHEEQGRQILKDKYNDVLNIITQYCESVGIYRINKEV